MLVLTRRLNEAFMIGENIRVLIVRIEEDQVRIGIEAPKDVTILREELFDVSTGDSAGDSVRSSAGLGGGLGDEDSGAE